MDNSSSFNLSLVFQEFKDCQGYLDNTILEPNAHEFSPSQILCFVLLGIFSSIGVIANYLVTYILTFKTKQTPLIALLRGMAISDTFLCLHYVFAWVIPFFLIEIPSKTSSTTLRTILNFQLLSIPFYMTGIN